jgi:hypothetical protein
MIINPICSSGLPLMSVQALYCPALQCAASPPQHRTDPPRTASQASIALQFNALQGEVHKLQQRALTSSGVREFSRKGGSLTSSTMPRSSQLPSRKASGWNR